jgi:pimeloyl-ACP methyl ester carboxylesterase
MATLQANGVELFYEQEGKGERVVLTHGAWSDGSAWQAVTPHLVDGFEVMTWDRRGHSRSGPGDEPGSVREDAADLAALIEALGADPAHVVGNSAGGAVVLNLMTMRPDLVRTAAVHEPGPMGLAAESGDPHLVQVVEQDKLHTDEVVRLIAAGEARPAAQYFVENVALGPGMWDQFPDELKATMETNAFTVTDDIRDGWDIDSVDIAALAASSVPLLISTGSESPELEKGAAHELARRLPAAQLETLTGAGHIPHRTHPDNYAAKLIGFMEGASIKWSHP